MILGSWIYSEWNNSETNDKVSLVKRLYFDLYEEAEERGSFPPSLSGVEDFPAFMASSKNIRKSFGRDLVTGKIVYYPENANVLLSNSSGVQWNLNESVSDGLLLSWTMAEGRINCSVRGAVEFELSN